MSKLERLTAKIFADNAPTGKIGQFGSALAGTKIETSNVEEIQALPAYTEGWSSAVISSKNYPTLEEMNGVMKVMSYQTAYTLQNGIPEYDDNTEYQTGSICKGVGNTSQYASLTNDNIGNNVTNSNYWKNVTPVNYSNITNCLLKVPQRIKLELVDGAVILKAGSEVIVPNGANVFDYIKIESDLSFNYSGTGTTDIFLLYNFTSNTLGYALASTAVSGTTAPTDSRLYYDSTNNIIDYYNNGKPNNIKYALPLAILSRSDGAITGIKQLFNGMGYIGSMVWVDKDVKGLAPNGRNADGSLNNIEVTSNGLFVRDIKSAYSAAQEILFFHDAYYLGDTADTTLQSGARYLEGLSSDKPSTLPNTYSWMYYATDENIYYISYGSTTAKWNKVELMPLSSQYFDGTNITSFNPKQPFRAVDYSEFKEIVADFLVPDYAAGVSVSSGYTANENGWLYIYHKNTGDGQSIAVSVDGTVVFESGDSGTWSTNLVASGFIFVGNGQQITYTGTGTNTLKFYPCKGGN